MQKPMNNSTYCCKSFNVVQKMQKTVRPHPAIKFSRKGFAFFNNRKRINNTQKNVCSEKKFSNMKFPEKKLL